MGQETSKTEPEPADRTSAPEALLCHRTKGRFRVRIAERRRDEEYLREVRRALERHVAVVAVETTALTASVLVVHRGELEEILTYAERAGLFQLVTREQDPAIVRWLDALDRFDTDVLLPRLNDKPQRAATGLFMLAVLQALRGSILPSAPTLLAEAMVLLREARARAEREARRNG